MIYGFLIGIIIAANILLLGNFDDPSMSPANRAGRSIIRMISTTAAIIAASSLIGLLIRGA